MCVCVCVPFSDSLFSLQLQGLNLNWLCLTPLLPSVYFTRVLALANTVFVGVDIFQTIRRATKTPKKPHNKRFTNFTTPSAVDMPQNTRAPQHIGHVQVLNTWNY